MNNLKEKQKTCFASFGLYFNWNGLFFLLNVLRIAQGYGNTPNKRCTSKDWANYDI